MGDAARAAGRLTSERAEGRSRRSVNVPPETCCGAARSAGERPRSSLLPALGTGYLYDADGELLIRRTPGDGDTVLYLGSTEVRLTVEGTTKKVTGTRYYSAAGQTLAVRTATSGTAGTTLSFLAADHHGTSSIATDATTQAVTKRYSTPFGAPRGTKPTSWPDDKAFLGKPADSATGLTHIGAREYDPGIGQFISVDPLLEIDKHQTLNGYSYAGQSPATNSDPTGTCLDPGNGRCQPGDNSGKPDPAFPKKTNPAPPKATSPSNRGGTSSSSGPAAAKAPEVTSSRLQGILNDIYLKPGSIPEVGTGKVGEALINELETGKPTKGLWHVADAADQLTRIAKLLEDDRKGAIPPLSAADRAVDLSEADELWKALDTKGKAGKITAILESNKKVSSSVKAAARRVIRAPSMASVTGGIYEEVPHEAPRLVNSPKLPKVIFGLGVAGELLWFLDSVKSIVEGDCVYDCDYKPQVA